MIKRTLALFFLLAALLGTLPLTAVQANAQCDIITDRQAVDGSDYTDSPMLAQKLDDIFDGNAGIYRDLACTVPVDTALGTSSVRNNGVYMFVDPVDGVAKNIGTSCWIYANGVYYTLFGESTGNGIGENSEKLSLAGTGSRSLTYDNLKAWGVRQGVGALIRASGHSMIVLEYDEDSLTILDGNSDGCGLVSISERSWDRVYGYVEYIIQPKEDYYSSLFSCGMCGKDATWAVSEDGTLTLSGSGSISYPGWREYNRQIKKVIIRDPQLEIGSGVFYNCTSLEQIVFQHNAPVFADNAFLGVCTSVYYPAARSGWTADVLQDYGGEPTWTAYGMTELKITQAPIVTFSQDRVSVRIEAVGDGLSYGWYTRAAGDESYVKSAFTGAEYCVKLSGTQQVVCAVKDRYGNVCISESVTLSPDGASGETTSP